MHSSFSFHSIVTKSGEGGREKHSSQQYIPYVPHPKIRHFRIVYLVMNLSTDSSTDEALSFYSNPFPITPPDAGTLSTEEHVKF